MSVTVVFRTSRRSLLVHLVYPNGVTVCGRRIELADEDEGGVVCDHCRFVASGQLRRLPARRSVVQL